MPVSQLVAEEYVVSNLKSVDLIGELSPDFSKISENSPGTRACKPSSLQST